MTEPVIGILGCGHLGMGLVKTMLSVGHPREKIWLSVSNIEKHRAAFEQEGLESRVTSNDDLIQKSDWVLLCVRPQVWPHLLHFKPRDSNQIWISCMAGWSTQQLSSALNTPVFRIMPSGPNSIEQGDGVAALFPYNETLEAWLKSLHIQPTLLKDEAEMHVFTASVCLPAAVVRARLLGRSLQPERILRERQKKHPFLSANIRWAFKSAEQFVDPAECEAMILRMKTPGGVTAALLEEFERSADIDLAFENAIERSQALAEQV